MSSILVISTEFYNQEIANTRCLIEMINGLQSSGHKVYVLTTKYSPKTVREYNVAEVIKVGMIFQQFLDTKIDYNGKNIILKFIFFIFSFILRHIERLIYPLKMKITAKRIIKEKKCDCVFSVFQNIGNHKLAYKLAKHNKNLKWIMYNLDQITFNSTNSPKLTDKYKKKEIAFSKVVYKIINVIGIDEEYINNDFQPYKNVPKIEVALPNLKPLSDDSKKSNDNGKIILRYMGRFYRNIRNPDELLRLIKDLDPDKYSVEFYGYSCKYLKENYKSLPPCVSLKGIASGEKYYELIGSADILINVGNVCSNQMPSKVFDYISSGNPILNFYFNDKEIGMRDLRRYPSILNIKVGETVTGAEIDDFCKKSKHISSQELRSIYYDALSENVIKRAVEFIEES